jgi:hypothetical protein
MYAETSQHTESTPIVLTLLEFLLFRGPPLRLFQIAQNTSQLMHLLSPAAFKSTLRGLGLTFFCLGAGGFLPRLPLPNQFGA